MSLWSWLWANLRPEAWRWDWSQVAHHETCVLVLLAFVAGVVVGRWMVRKAAASRTFSGLANPT